MHERIIFEKIKPGDVPGYRSATMERDGEAVKVGAGGTAASGAARKPLLQAVRDGDFKTPEASHPDINETSVWLFECWHKARERDQAALAALNARFAQIRSGVRARQRLGWLLSATAGAVCGAVAAAAYLSARV